MAIVDDFIEVFQKPTKINENDLNCLYFIANLAVFNEIESNQAEK